MSNYGAFGENNPVWKGVSRVADMMLMGLLFLLTCLPVFTIGAALSGFYYAAMDSMRKEDGYIFKRYFSAFGKNFKKATLIWLIMLVLAGLCGMNVYCWVKYSDMKIAPVMLGLSLIMCIAWLMTFIFVFPLQARFENTIGKTIENAFLLAISHLPFTLVIIVMIGMVAFMVYVSWLVALIMILIGTGVLGYLTVRYFELNFKKWGYIDEDDGKIKEDDYDFQVELDYDALYGDRSENSDDTEAAVNGIDSKEIDGEYDPEQDTAEKEDTIDE
ncbi:MAG: DUF624 domain-containing protein [Lachnospiraceae bacterium]|nr:DUF624 domain-containing protein [Lachnospiraceae bacterium]